MCFEGIIDWLEKPDQLQHQGTWEATWWSRCRRPGRCNQVQVSPSYPRLSQLTGLYHLGRSLCTWIDNQVPWTVDDGSPVSTSFPQRAPCQCWSSHGGACHALWCLQSSRGDLSWQQRVRNSMSRRVHRYLVAPAAVLPALPLEHLAVGGRCLRLLAVPLESGHQISANLV